MTPSIPTNLNRSPGRSSFFCRAALLMARMAWPGDPAACSRRFRPVRCLGGRIAASPARLSTTIFRGRRGLTQSHTLRNTHKPREDVVGLAAAKGTIHMRIARWIVVRPALNANGVPSAAPSKTRRVHLAPLVYGCFDISVRA